MYGPQPLQQKHNTKLYIVMVTLVIGAIFFLLFINNDNSGFGLTSFTVRDTGSGENAALGDISSEKASAKDVFANLDQEDEKTTPRASRDSTKNLNEVEVVLSFDTVPEVKRQARIKDLELKFDDLTTKISVNNDKLELSNLKEVSLHIRGFVGQMQFSELGFSLRGTAKSIAVNDVTLSAKGDLKIAFDNLNYNSFTIEDLELNDLELSSGSGSLEVAQKLQYSLDHDQVTFNYFNGKISVDKQAESVLNVEGVARGISISGALLNLNVR